MTKLKLTLVAKGIKQIQMAYDLKTNPSHLNRIVNGWLVPGEDMKARIAAYLECPTALLWPPEPQEKRGTQPKHQKNDTRSQQ